MIYCGKCRSDNVHLLAWVGANTKEFKEWLDDNHMGWCESCEAQVNVKYLPDDYWEKKKIEESDRESSNTTGSDD